MRSRFLRRALVVGGGIAGCWAALSAAGGWDITPAEIYATGLRITHQARRFLLREGFTHADDRLSARAYHKLSSGPIAGKALTPDELEAGMQAQCFQQRAEAQKMLLR
jgi:aldehyde:ferredoxin oxidoreductase